MKLGGGVNGRVSFGPNLRLLRRTGPRRRRCTLISPQPADLASSR